MAEEVIPEWRLKARAWADQQAAAKAGPAAVDHDADLIPDAPYEADPVDAEVDRIVDRVDILDAYARWCGKMSPEVGTKRESIMISCPRPDHPDLDPSAWINLDKQTWFCGGCQEGGDALDIAAYHFGFDVPGYKVGKSFPDLRRRIAEEYGLVVRTTPTGQRYTDVVTVETAPKASASHEDSGKDCKDPSNDGPPTFSRPLTSFSPSSTGPSLESPPLSDGGVTVTSETFSTQEAISHASSAGKSGAPPPARGDEATITDISTGLELTPEAIIAPPSIPWREIISDDGFLAAWMAATGHDDLPEEYYFTLGLLALGLAAGRDVTLGDHPEVRGNLYVCLLGPSGSGKSRSIGLLQRLITEALPFDDSDPFTKGTAFMSPGSAESLIDGFSRPIVDPSDPKVTLGFAPVRGLVRFDELSTLVGRSMRMGSVMKPTLMEFFDGYSEVVHRTRGMGTIRAVDHFATSVTTTQPKAIKELLTAADADSGFLNRWIFAMGPSKPANPFGGVSFDLRAPVAGLSRTFSWAALRPRHLLPTPDALALWSDHFTNILQPMKMAEDADALLARIDLTLKKLMLLLAVDRHHDAIEVEDVADSLKMWDYLINSYGFVSGQLGFGQFEEIHQAIIWACQSRESRGKGAISMREINRSLAKRKFPIDLLAKVVSAMTLVGELEEEVVKPLGGGRPTVRYRYIA